MWGEPFIEVGGRQLECRCWGAAPSDGRAIALLHEGLGCVALWRDFPDRLHEATGWPVMAYSRAGYGQSDPDSLPRPLDWMTREALDVLPDVLAAFEINGPVLLGHSDGATIAAIYAGAHQPLATVLMAPHFFTEESGLAEIARANAAFGESDMAARMGKYHRDPVATFRGWADAWLDPAFRDWNVEESLDTITGPVLALQGRQVQYGTLAQIETVGRRVAGAQVTVLEDCRHVPHLEQPEATLTAITKLMHDNALYARKIEK